MVWWRTRRGVQAGNYSTRARSKPAAQACEPPRLRAVRPAAGYDYGTFASDLADVLTQLDLSDVALAGFSMEGGDVARYLGRHGASGRVTKAMLLGAVPPFLLRTDDNPDGVDKAVFDGMLESVRNDHIAFVGS